MHGVQLGSIPRVSRIRNSKMNLRSYRAETAAATASRQLPANSASLEQTGALLAGFPRPPR